MKNILFVCKQICFAFFPSWYKHDLVLLINVPDITQRLDWATSVRKNKQLCLMSEKSFPINLYSPHSIHFLQDTKLIYYWCILWCILAIQPKTHSKRLEFLGFRTLAVSTNELISWIVSDRWGKYKCVLMGCQDRFEKHCF